VADPLSEIRIAPKGCGEDYSDALIVLPEALDLKNYYCDKAAPVFGISDLEDLAREFSVAFVAGLSDTESRRGSGTVAGRGTRHF